MGKPPFTTYPLPQTSLQPSMPSRRHQAPLCLRRDLRCMHPSLRARLLTALDSPRHHFRTSGFLSHLLPYSFLHHGHLSPHHRPILARHLHRLAFHSTGSALSTASVAVLGRACKISVSSPVMISRLLLMRSSRRWVSHALAGIACFAFIVGISRIIRFSFPLLLSFFDISLAHILFTFRS